MKNKIKSLIMVILILSTTLLSGCYVDGTSHINQVQSLESVESTRNVKMGTSFDWEQKFTEENQQNLIKTTTPPKLQYSLERENLIRRYEFLNDRDKVFYVYLMSYGKVVAFYTAKGKISSVNSRLTQQQQVFDAESIKGVTLYNADQIAVVDSPQLDGSYGTNGDGIFFFTTEGAYVEWNSEYLVSDFPLSITTPPQLVKELN